MGHKSGLKHAGAVGKSERMDVAAELNAGDELDIRDLALEHAPAAMKTLAAAQKLRSKAPWPTKIAAANSILDRADGKPATKEAEAAKGGLHITINQLYGPQQPEMKTFDAADLAKDVTDAVTPEEIEHGTMEVDMHGDGVLIRTHSPLSDKRG